MLGILVLVGGLGCMVDDFGVCGIVVMFFVCWWFEFVEGEVDGLVVGFILYFCFWWVGE